MTCASVHPLAAVGLSCTCSLTVSKCFHGDVTAMTEARLRRACETRSPTALTSPHRLWLARGFVLAVLTWAAQAGAYCRQRTCKDDRSKTCQRETTNECVTEGRELSYDTPCLSFAIAAGSGATVGLNDIQFEAMVLDAFHKWGSVDCGAGRPGFLVQSMGVVEASSPLYCEIDPRQNVSVFFFISDWPKEDEEALGFTTVKYLPEAAVIVDADVKLNADYVRRKVAAEREEVVRAVILHEVGHYLGLAHSNDAYSVMAAEYDPARFVLPDLTTDDVNGICAVFPPSHTPAVCPNPPLNDAALSSDACRADELSREPASCTIADVAPSAWPAPSTPSSQRWWLAACAGLLLSVARVVGRRTTQ